jgi:hypothetical protein
MESNYGQQVSYFWFRRIHRHGYKNKYLIYILYSPPLKYVNDALTSHFLGL